MIDALDSNMKERQNVFVEGNYAYIGNIFPMCKMNLEIKVKRPPFKSFKNRTSFTWKLKSKRFLTKRRNK